MFVCVQVRAFGAFYYIPLIYRGVIYMLPTFRMYTIDIAYVLARECVLLVHSVHTVQPKHIIYPGEHVRPEKHTYIST